MSPVGVDAMKQDAYRDASSRASMSPPPTEIARIDPVLVKISKLDAPRREVRACSLLRRTAAGHCCVLRLRGTCLATRARPQRTTSKEGVHTWRIELQLSQFLMTALRRNGPSSSSSAPDSRKKRSALRLATPARRTATSSTAAKSTHAKEGAIAGVAAGAGVGALWGLGILAGVLPGIGTAIAGGTLAAILSSAAAGAADRRESRAR